MSVRNGAGCALPRSHVFITIARGASARTFMARSSLAIAATIALPILVVWLAASTLYLVFHDDLVASLMLRQRDMQYDYEDKIAALRSQLSHEQSRQLVSQRSVESKLDELASRESELQLRSGIVARLEDQAGRLVAGVAPRPTARDLSRGEEQPAPTPSDAPPIERDRMGNPKPHPEAAVSVRPDAEGDRLPEDHDGAIPVHQRMSELSTRLDTISIGQETQIARLDQRARNALTRYRDALAVAGLSEQRFTAHDENASGGPFVPLARDDASPFARAAVGLQLTLGQAVRLQSSIARVPFNKPLHGDPEITSPFGARVDPFLGRPAMHTGIDLAEDNGTEVHATAPGRITVAGPVSGYGTMVEIDHGNGLATRYAHLSETGVSVGDTVHLGEMVGRVGATGRATGPHLHYETRIDGEAVDPLRFLAAGQRLLGAGPTL